MYNKDNLNYNGFPIIGFSVVFVVINIINYSIQNLQEKMLSQYPFLHKIQHGSS